MPTVTDDPQLQFQLRSKALLCCFRWTVRARWPRMNRSGRARSELLMQFGGNPCGVQIRTSEVLVLFSGEGPCGNLIAEDDFDLPVERDTQISASRSPGCGLSPYGVGGDRRFGASFLSPAPTSSQGRHLSPAQAIVRPAQRDRRTVQVPPRTQFGT